MELYYHSSIPRVGAEHIVAAIVLADNVTAPFLASTRPFTTAPVFTVIDVNASMLPWNEDPVPSVAELPTCQNTLHARAPFMRATLLPDAVMSVEAV